MKVQHTLIKSIYSDQQKVNMSGARRFLSFFFFFTSVTLSTIAKYVSYALDMICTCVRHLFDTSLAHVYYIQQVIG